MIRRTHLKLLALAALAAMPSLAVAATHKATARLNGSMFMTGHARYQEKLVNGKRDQRFKVNVARAMPLQPLQVRVNGRPVGVAIANIAGSAKINLRTGGKGVADPMPSNFPVIRSGDVVTVGSMSGVCYEDNQNGQYQLEGKTHVGSSEYKAEYKERQVNGTLTRKFEVEIEAGPADTSFDIVVKGSVVGSITTNSLGYAELEFHSGTDDSGNHIPMPGDFPTLQPGDTVTIGSVTVTLAVDDHGGGGSGGDDGDDDDNDDDHGGGGSDDGPGDDHGGDD